MLLLADSFPPCISFNFNYSALSGPSLRIKDKRPEIYQWKIIDFHKYLFDFVVSSKFLGSKENKNKKAFEFYYSNWKVETKQKVSK